MPHQHALQKAHKGRGRQAATDSNVLVESTVFVFPVLLRNSMPIPSPLGKAKEKAETTKFVQTYVKYRSFNVICLISCLFCCLPPSACNAWRESCSVTMLQCLLRRDGGINGSCACTPSAVVLSRHLCFSAERLHSRPPPLAAIAGVAEVRGPRDRTIS